MQLSLGFNNSDVVLAVDVSGEMLVEDFMVYVLEEAGFPHSATTNVQRHSKSLDGSKTLEENGVVAEDVLIVSNDVPVSQPAPEGAEGDEIEQTRQKILYDPELFSTFSEQSPELAAAIHDPEQFRSKLLAIQRANAQAWQDPERVKEITERQQLDENMAAAIEEMPELFVPVTMLYISVEINGHPVKAFVDSGAQSTILNPECAERCGLSHLIDKRYKGTAFGVGQTEIKGRIHMAPIKIGSNFYPCGFSVLEKMPFDMLFGLDMLRHHQASIDLKQNGLVIGDEICPFLPESECPKTSHELPGPQGVQQPFAGAARRPAANAAARPQQSLGASTGGQRLGSAQQQSQRPPQQPPQQRPQPQRQPTEPPRYQSPGAAPYPQEVVQSLVGFGFSTEQVLNALHRTNGNAEVAASLLFEEN